MQPIGRKMQPGEFLVSTGSPGEWTITYVILPPVQLAGATQASLTDSTGGTPSTTLAAIAAGAAYAQSDLVAVKNAIASLAALTNAMQAVLVTTGIMKGGA